GVARGGGQDGGEARGHDSSPWPGDGAGARGYDTRRRAGASPVHAPARAGPAPLFSPAGYTTMDSACLIRDQLNAMINSWVATVTTPFVTLWTDDFHPDPLSDLTVLKPPVGTWYAPKPTTFGTPFDDLQAGLRVVCSSVQFQYSGASPAEAVMGYSVGTHSVGPPVVNTPVIAFRLASPFTFAGPYDALVIEPSLIWPYVVQH